MDPLPCNVILYVYMRRLTALHSLSAIVSFNSAAAPRPSFVDGQWVRERTVLSSSSRRGVARLALQHDAPPLLDLNLVVVQ